jgi:hypothetical protein
MRIQGEKDFVADDDLSDSCFVAIELLNEPRLGQADFEMDDLKAFYTAGSEAVRTADQGMGVMIHGECLLSEPSSCLSPDAAGLTPLRCHC